MLIALKSFCWKLKYPRLILQLELETYIVRFALIRDFTDVYYKTDLLYIKIKTNNIVLKYQHNKVNI